MERIESIKSKQMLQWLPIALAKVKAGNTSENLLNEILQVLCSLYRAKKVTKRVYNNIISSIKITSKCILYLWILKIVKHLILIDYYSIL